MTRWLFATMVFCWAVPAMAAGWGSVEGQFILEGDVPDVPPLVREGDPTVKDAAVCAAEPVPNDAMAFNPESKGIGNIVVFMRRAPEVHPDLKSSPEKEVVFDQKGCRYLPHVLIVRTDQNVVCKSSDSVSHNVHTQPFANTSQNFIVNPNDQTGVQVQMPIAESIPVQVKCDIHPHMQAWWIVVNHPYAAVTDKDGKFKIENLPEGDHEFIVWHELAGYINRKFKVSVKDGETTKVEAVEVPLASFKK